jgi:hypothetical protein
MKFAAELVAASERLETRRIIAQELERQAFADAAGCRRLRALAVTREQRNAYIKAYKEATMK